MVQPIWLSELSSYCFIYSLKSLLGGSYLKQVGLMVTPPYCHATIYKIKVCTKQTAPGYKCIQISHLVFLIKNEKQP